MKLAIIFENTENTEYELYCPTATSLTNCNKYNKDFCLPYLTFVKTSIIKY